MSTFLIYRLAGATDPIEVRYYYSFSVLRRLPISISSGLDK